MKVFITYAIFGIAYLVGLASIGAFLHAVSDANDQRRIEARP